MPKFNIYRDNRSEYRWRLVADNGRIIADSGEGYVSKSEAKRAVERFKEAAPKAEIVEGKPQGGQ